MEHALEPPPTTQEHRIIQSLLPGLRPPPPWLQVGIGDDGAVLKDGTALTIDTLCEGVHFLPGAPPADVGFKAVAVSVSDLASMGARPMWALLSLSLPAQTAQGAKASEWSQAFAEGLHQALQHYGVHLVGGDTTGAVSQISVSLTMGGTLVGSPMLRSGGRAGELVWTTGTLGLGGAGWALDEAPEAALRAQRRPEPPLDFALALARSGLATAAMDLSDGLYADLSRLCRASHTGALIQPDALPAPPCLLHHAELLQLQTMAGEDFQLLFTTQPQHRGQVLALARAQAQPIHEIGVLTTGPEVLLGTQPWPPPRFDHFMDRP